MQLEFQNKQIRNSFIEPRSPQKHLPYLIQKASIHGSIVVATVLLYLTRVKNALKQTLCKTNSSCNLAKF